ncbi:MAG: acetylglutamate kinase [Acidobacteria bacterium RIFCSPLOWO2_12_FULL_54_10]|nr:MAG: acetylglutamate kinase [Acidobacteria bacterium RIFCSPLOWO2_12_FULL_54_10]
MKIVVKIGGTLLESSADRQRLVAEIAAQWRSHHQVLVVHGGGKQLTQYLDQAGIASRFVDGLRVTTLEAIDGVLKVFTGSINHQLLAVFHQAEVPAVGLSGIDSGSLVAQKFVGPHGQDWGFVGQITAADPHLWEVLLKERFVPLVASVAVGDDGQIYNINADQAAVACAASLRADSLVFLTDVDGVRDLSGQILPRISVEQIPALLDSGAVSGGMLAKLRAVREAIEHGVGRVCIANGHRPGSLAAALAFTGASIETFMGTIITSAHAPAQRSS